MFPTGSFFKLACTFSLGLATLTPVPAAWAVYQTPNRGEQRSTPPVLPPPPTDDGEADLATPALPQTLTRDTLENGVTVLKQHIDGTDAAAAVVMLHVGSMHDPVEAPGMSRLLDHLLISAPSEGVGFRTTDDLDEKYRLGWNIRSQPWSTTYGIVVKRDELADELGAVARRLRTLAVGPESLSRALTGVEKDMAIMFDERPLLKPMSWLVAKAFRHDSGAARGIDVQRMGRLRPERVQQEWNSRIVGGNVTIVLVGNVDGLDVDTAVKTAFGDFQKGNAPDWKITFTPVGAVTRDVLDSHDLPSGEHHGTAAFFAPDITHADHPAFSVVAHSFMLDAAKQPGSQARLDFQYDALLDARAAYLTPHSWRFPKGYRQALGYWDAKIKNAKFSRTDPKRYMTASGWQLGDALPGEVVEELQRNSALLYTIAFATGWRNLHGDDAFWQGYRDHLQRLDAREMSAVRDRYFADSNRAIFILNGE